LATLLSFFGFIFIYGSNFSKNPEDIKNIIPEKIQTEVEGIVTEVKESAQKIKAELNTSPPLVVEKTAPTTFEIPELTELGIFVWTNIQRNANSGNGNLDGNNLLNEIAKRRLLDMFENQYFAHDSPTGENAGILAEEIGYPFIAMGENIARGNFSNDQELVQAWMDSPGHRANILSSKFTEIGIAIQKRAWQGRETWIGVQIFAKPISACPETDENLKANIETNQTRIKNLTVQAEDLADYLEKQNPKTKAEADNYNQKVNEYNNLVAQINALVGETKNMIDIYNKQVNQFNACLNE